MRQGKRTAVIVILLAMVCLWLMPGSASAQEPFAEMDDVIAQLEGFRYQGDILLGQVRGAGDPGTLQMLWQEALMLERRAMDTVALGLSIARSVPVPTEEFQKTVIIFEKFHVKVVTTIVIIKLTILRISEEWAVPQGPPEAEIGIIGDISDQIRTLKDSAQMLADEVRAATTPGELPALWHRALDLEDQLMPMVIAGLDIAQGVPDPTFFLKKKIILFEKWHIKVVDLIVIVKLLIIQLNEEMIRPFAQHDQAEVDHVITLYEEVEQMEDAADVLIAQIESGAGGPGMLEPLFMEALMLEQQALPLLQEGLSIARDSTTSTLLKKKIIILEVRVHLVILEITIAKMLIIEWIENYGMPPGDPYAPPITDVAMRADYLEGMDYVADDLLTDARAISDIVAVHDEWPRPLLLEEEAIPVFQEGINIALAAPEKSEFLMKRMVILEAWMLRLITNITIVKLYILKKDQEYPGCCGAFADSQYPYGYTGNTNCSSDGKRTLSDITKLIDAVYISKEPLCCHASGNTNGSPDCKITLSDITKLIDAVYVSGSLPAKCMPECEE